MNTRLKVSETMDRDPLVASGAISVLEAARQMRDRGVGSLLVYEEGLKGIVTERDILHKVVAEGKDASGLTVKDIMSVDLVSISPGDDILTALRLMRQRRIRRLPVQENGNLAGLLTERHISQVAPELLQIADDWDTIRNGNGENGYRAILEEDTFIPGRCEACSNEDVDLHESDGTLLCEECLEAQETESRIV
jgi:CBS domain-containing protein